MKKPHQKIALLAAAAVVGTNIFMSGSVTADKSANVGKKSSEIAVTAKSDYGSYEEAIAQLMQQGVISGYSDGKMKPHQNIKRAEFAKMLVLGLKLESNKDDIQLEDVKQADWYYKYVDTVAELGVMKSEDGKFKPNSNITHAEMAEAIAKGLQRDVMSIRSWMDGYSADQFATRGDALQLLATSQKSIRSESAKMTNIRSLNKVTMEVTFNQPLTQENESLEAGMSHFVFDNGLKLVNQPRLKTGSFSTYILPTTTQTPGTTYTLNYRDSQSLKVEASDELIRTNEARQVDKDSFEIEVLKSDGVVDYGYMISVYSGGRGSNAMILDENNTNNGQQYQIVPSLRSRNVMITPEGGEPMTAHYLPFTQSTDGNQEPKFRLANGAKLKPGVKYTVTSDWLTLKNPAFVAKEAASVQINSVAQVDASHLNVTLSQDPGDEIFVQREVKLTGSDGSEAKAQYTVQSRKGATGTFVMQNEAKLTTGVTYTVQPIGDWAVSPEALTLQRSSSLNPILFLSLPKSVNSHRE